MNIEIIFLTIFSKLKIRNTNMKTLLTYFMKVHRGCEELRIRISFGSNSKGPRGNGLPSRPLSCREVYNVSIFAAKASQYVVKLSAASPVEFLIFFFFFDGMIIININCKLDRNIIRIISSIKT